MLAMGVRLLEVSASRLKREDRLRRVLGSSTGRLHAKMGFIDRTTFLAGSLNLDARSARINTEVGIAVRSPALAEAMLRFYRIDSAAGLYELKLGPDGEQLLWTVRDEDGQEQAGGEPETSWWLRLKLWWLSLFVPQDLL
jgi:putative cardiolipin synthase